MAEMNYKKYEERVAKILTPLRAHKRSVTKKAVHFVAKHRKTQPVVMVVLFAYLVLVHGMMCAISALGNLLPLVQNAVVNFVSDCFAKLPVVKEALVKVVNRCASLVMTFGNKVWNEKKNFIPAMKDACKSVVENVIVVISTIISDTINADHKFTRAVATALAVCIVFTSVYTPVYAEELGELPTVTENTDETTTPAPETSTENLPRGESNENNALVEGGDGTNVTDPNGLTDSNTNPDTDPNANPDTDPVTTPDANANENNTNANGDDSTNQNPDATTNLDGEVGEEDDDEEEGESEEDAEDEDGDAEDEAANTITFELFAADENADDFKLTFNNEELPTTYSNEDLPLTLTVPTPVKKFSPQGTDEADAIEYEFHGWTLQTENGNTPYTTSGVVTDESTEIVIPEGTTGDVKFVASWSIPEEEVVTYNISFRMLRVRLILQRTFSKRS